MPAQAKGGKGKKPARVQKEAKKTAAPKQVSRMDAFDDQGTLTKKKGSK